MRKKICIAISVLIVSLIISCSSVQEKEEKADSGGVVDLIIEKAQSPEGQKAIQTAKEKLQDKETQEKIKSSLSGKKKN